MSREEAKSLAAQAARQVEEAIDAAEARAKEIVVAAEREAERIRAAAEAAAEERIRRAQDAVERLVAEAGQLRDAVAGSERPDGEPPPPEPATPPPPEPATPPPVAERRSTEDLIEQLKAPPAEPDEAGARLVAMKMALDGKPRAEVEQHLAANFQLDSADALLDDVYSRVAK